METCLLVLLLLCAIRACASEGCLAVLALGFRRGQSVFTFLLEAGQSFWWQCRGELSSLVEKVDEVLRYGILIKVHAIEAVVNLGEIPWCENTLGSCLPNRSQNLIGYLRGNHRLPSLFHWYIRYRECVTQTRYKSAVCNGIELPFRGLSKTSRNSPRWWGILGLEKTGWRNKP